MSGTTMSIDKAISIEELTKSTEELTKKVKECAAGKTDFAKTYNGNKTRYCRLKAPCNYAGQKVTAAMSCESFDARYCKKSII